MRLCLAVLAGGLLAAAAPATAGTCGPRDEQAVVGTVRAMFDALAAEDEARLRAILADGFYAFDGGRRFDGRALQDLIKAAHASGKIYRWSVTRPDVRIDCVTAWVAYVNEGMVGDAAGLKPQTWLESAALRFVDGRWRVEFLHSTRALPVP